MEEQQQERAEPVSPHSDEKVKLRHPHTGDIREVDAVPAQMVPLMGLGYEQVKG